MVETKLMEIVRLCISRVNKVEKGESNAWEIATGAGKDHRLCLQ